MYDLIDDTRRHRGHVINPTLETSPLPETMPDPDELEGCLSVPGERYPTGRADWARVVGVDIDNNPISVEGTCYLARCLQHETDHLAGHLYLDRLVGGNHRAARTRRPQDDQTASVDRPWQYVGPRGGP